MTKTLPTLDIFTSNPVHRRFAAWSKASSPTKANREVVVIAGFTDFSTASIMIAAGDYAWRIPANGSIDRPTIRANVDPASEQFATIWAHTPDAAKSPAKIESQEGRIEDFLDQVYSLIRINDTDSATDRIFDYVDRLLCDGQFVVCDEILRSVNVERLPTSLMRSFLSITAAAKSRLPSRGSLYRKIESKMVQLRGMEKTKRIIGSLA